ncbi:MAG TPA: hypothetical protein H9841_05775 [Candidatus Flavonifractor merdigallinarum]|uniref:Uncharacterized protein n=1 Tax=Candidatus Flavonifractor merdigallinarum TaxID=2838589 RepID=A0A9D1Y8R4_9FIRM|nr:hypothetical protein [Candidatus Flavonifractor merdigallinarum]
MSTYINLLYDYFVGYPTPERWPEELQNNPVAGHGRYAFEEGFRLGVLLMLESTAGELLWP